MHVNVNVPEKHTNMKAMTPNHINTERKPSLTKLTMLLLAAFSCYFLPDRVYAQQEDISPQLKTITTKESSARLVFFKPELNLNAKNIFATQKQAFGLSTMDQMLLAEIDTCSLGDVHYDFQQYHHGIPVVGAVYVVHEHAGKAESGNGRIISGINVSTIPQVSEAAALQAALQAFGASKYQWEVPGMEAWLKSIKEDTTATFYPKGKLVIFNPLLDKNPANFRLAWEFLINSNTPFDSREYYVDAITGAVLRQFPRITSTSAVGSATTVYSGVRTIVTDYIGFLNKTYRLIDNSRGAGIQTWNLRDYNENQLDSAVNFTDADNIWNNVNADQDEYATDVHWGMAMTYDYFKNVHAHRGMDGADAKKMNAYAHLGGTYRNNAFYWSGGGDIYAYGDGNAVTTNPKVSLDIVAHEFTHSVTQHVVTGGLEYQDESGALNEAYSDIFGVLVEYWIKGNNPGLWLFGEDIWIGGGHTRNIPDPKSKGQPSTYKRIPWYFGADDHGGVHRNNSVGTLWFYYLVNGGSGKNDKPNNNEFSVRGIGLAKAEKIAFRTLSHYHTRFDDYDDARTISYKAAMDLFCTIKPVDSCCEEARQVLNAWYAVGVGDPLLMFEKIEIKKPECDSANGEATAFVKGVKGTPKYEWSNGDTTAKADSLAPGTYTLTVTDTSTGCSIDTTIKVKENANFYFDAMAAGVYKCGVADGWASVYYVVTGTPEIIWSNGGTTKKIENLAPGDYFVTVTDTSTGCDRDTMVTVKEWGPKVQVVGGGNRTICKGSPMPSFTLTALTEFCVDCEYTWSTGAKTSSITVSNPGGYSVTVKSGNCTATAGTSVNVWIKDCDSADEWEVPVIASSDPNDITGPIGYGEPHFVNTTDPMHYLVRFENDPIFATAAARKVIVTVPLHPRTTLFTFKLGDFGFGDFIFSVPENSTFYTTRLDVSDSLGVAVDVTAGINIANREAFWIFNSVDPVTGLEPADATLGFLPVNDSIRHLGEGFVNFSIQPASGLQTGDSISKQAVIVFDINEEIPTNIWTNLVDAVSPTSQVDSLPAHSGSTTIPIRFSGTDDMGGSGIATYSLYYSRDNGPFTFYREFSTDTNAYFTGDPNVSYSFFSLAKDNVGNLEAMKQLPEAVTILHPEPVYYWRINGNVRYANAVGTILNGTGIHVYDTASDLVGTDTADQNGMFSFPELIQGDYLFVNSYTGPWGGGNATDALLIMKHFAQLDTLEGVQAVVADVNASGFINASDAQAVASRFVDAINSFPAGDWGFYPGLVNLRSDTFLAIKGLCYGDVNGTFVPGAKASPTLSLKTGEPLYLAQNVEYTIPVKINQRINLNAASLVLRYPSQHLEILGLDMPGIDANQVFWRNDGNSIRLAWFSLTSRDINAGDIILNIRIKLKSDIKAKDLTFSLDALSQLSDPDAKVIQGASLLMPLLKTGEKMETPTLASYPNPFVNQTEMRYHLTEPAWVEIQIFDALGNLVKTYPGKEMPAGDHVLTFVADQLASGVYIGQMEVKTATTRQVVSYRMVLNRQEGQ